LKYIPPISKLIQKIAGWPCDRDWSCPVAGRICLINWP